MTRVTVERDGDVAIATMDDGRGNALDTTMLQELGALLQTTKDAGALVLRGRAKVFCGGLDVPGLLAFDRSQMQAFLELFDRVHEALHLHPVPIVTVASGSAVAGGAILFAAGDVRLAGPQGKIGVNEVALGLNLPAATIEILRFALGSRGLAEAAQTGQLYEGEERRRVGFASRIVPADALDEEALEAARVFARNDRSALAALRAQLRVESRKRIERDAASTREQFAELWFGDAAQGRLRALVATLRR